MPTFPTDLSSLWDPSSLFHNLKLYISTNIYFFHVYQPQWDTTSNPLEWLLLTQRQEIAHVREDVEKRKLSNTVDGTVN